MASPSTVAEPIAKVDSNAMTDPNTAMAVTHTTGAPTTVADIAVEDSNDAADLNTMTNPIAVANSSLATDTAAMTDPDASMGDLNDAADLNTTTNPIAVANSSLATDTAATTDPDASMGDLNDAVDPNTTANPIAMANSSLATDTAVVTDPATSMGDSNDAVNPNSMADPTAMATSSAATEATAIANPGTTVADLNTMTDSPTATGSNAAASSNALTSSGTAAAPGAVTAPSAVTTSNAMPNPNTVAIANTVSRIIINVDAFEGAGLFVKLPPELRNIVCGLLGWPPFFVVAEHTIRDEPIVALAAAIPRLALELCRAYIAQGKFFIEADECKFRPLYEFARYGALKLLWKDLHHHLCIQTSGAPDPAREAKNKKAADRPRYRFRRQTTRAPLPLLKTLELVNFSGQITFLELDRSSSKQVKAVNDFIARYFNSATTAYDTKMNGTQINAGAGWPAPPTTRGVVHHFRPQALPPPFLRDQFVTHQIRFYQVQP